MRFSSFSWHKFENGSFSSVKGRGRERRFRLSLCWSWNRWTSVLQFLGTISHVFVRQRTSLCSCMNWRTHRRSHIALIEFSHWQMFCLTFKVIEFTIIILSKSHGIEWTGGGQPLCRRQTIYLFLSRTKIASSAGYVDLFTLFSVVSYDELSRCFVCVGSWIPCSLSSHVLMISSWIVHLASMCSMCLLYLLSAEQNSIESMKFNYFYFLSALLLSILTLPICGFWNVFDAKPMSY